MCKKYYVSKEKIYYEKINILIVIIQSYNSLLIKKQILKYYYSYRKKKLSIQMN